VRFFPVSRHELFFWFNVFYEAYAKEKNTHFLVLVCVFSLYIPPYLRLIHLYTIYTLDTFSTHDKISMY